MTTAVTNNTSNAAQTALKSTADANSADAMQTKFLNLLVTQLKNQDPLNPMDNAQMTTQLAQISTVSGIEKLNSTLQTLLEGYNTSQNMQAASLIGHAVLTPGNQMTLGATGAVGGLELEKAADSVTVTIRDADGNRLQEVDLGKQAAGTLNFLWDGLDKNGNAMPQGSSYSFTVEAKQGTDAVKATALQAGMVNAVTLSSDGMRLELSTGNSVAYSTVKQIL